MTIQSHGFTESIGLFTKHDLKIFHAGRYLYRPDGGSPHTKYVFLCKNRVMENRGELVSTGDSFPDRGQGAGRDPCPECLRITGK